ncbi:hypothetical protein M9458_050836, partial [Cirrhinus mrigala]
RAAARRLPHTRASPRERRCGRGGRGRVSPGRNGEKRVSRGPAEDAGGGGGNDAPRRPRASRRPPVTDLCDRPVVCASHERGGPPAGPLSPSGHRAVSPVPLGAPDPKRPPGAAGRGPSSGAQRAPIGQRASVSGPCRR